MDKNKEIRELFETTPYVELLQDALEQIDTLWIEVAELRPGTDPGLAPDVSLRVAEMTYFERLQAGMFLEAVAQTIIERTHEQMLTSDLSPEQIEQTMIFDDPPEFL